MLYAVTAQVVYRLHFPNCCATMASSFINGIAGIKQRICMMPPFHSDKKESIESQPVQNHIEEVKNGNRSDSDDESDVPESPRRYVPQSLEYFMANTNFSRIELQSLYRNFKNECPTGIVNEDTFKAICCQFFPYGDAKSYAHFIFLAFDINEEGHIDFEQFVIGLSTLLRGSLQDRLKWIFRLYDVNHDGVISKEEMLMVVRSLYKMLGSSVTPPLSDRTYITHTERIFSKFDANQDGHITMKEFCEVCSKDESIILSMSIFDTAI